MDPAKHQNPSEPEPLPPEAAMCSLYCVPFMQAVVLRRVPGLGAGPLETVGGLQDSQPLWIILQTPR